MSTKLNRRERKAAQLLRHYATCEALGRYLGMDAPDGKKISVALFKLEAMAHNGAEAACNGEISDQTWNWMQSNVRTGIYTLLGKLPVGLFVNGDPRGYALKIDNESEEGRKLIEAVRAILVAQLGHQSALFLKKNKTQTKKQTSPKKAALP